MSDNEEKKVVSLAGARESKGKEKEKSIEDKEQKEDKQPVVCSFCARPNHLVIKMIEGPGVNICSECTMICLQYFMLSDRIPSEEARRILDSFWSLSKNK